MSLWMWPETRCGHHRTRISEPTSFRWGCRPCSPLIGWGVMWVEPETQSRCSLSSRKMWRDWRERWVWQGLNMCFYFERADWVLVLVPPLRSSSVVTFNKHIQSGAPLDWAEPEPNRETTHSSRPSRPKVKTMVALSHRCHGNQEALHSVAMVTMLFLEMMMMKRRREEKTIRLSFLLWGRGAAGFWNRNQVLE